MKKGDENANTGLWFFLTANQASLHPPLLCNWLDAISSLFLCITCLHYIMKSFTSSKPPTAPGENSQVTKEESLAAGHAICFADEAGQSREVGGIIFMSVAVQHYFIFLFFCFSTLPAAFPSISVSLVGVASTFSLW